LAIAALVALSMGTLTLLAQGPGGQRPREHALGAVIS